MSTEGIQPELPQQLERLTPQSQVTGSATSQRASEYSPTVRRDALSQRSIKDRIRISARIGKGGKPEKEESTEEQNKIPELVNSDLERLRDIERLEIEIRELKKRPNYALLFAKTFFKELVKPSQPSESTVTEPTLTDPIGNFSYDLSKKFPTIKEEEDNRREQSSFSPKEEEKLADYEQAVVRHRFTKRVFAEEGLQLERGLVELYLWEKDPGLVEVMNTPEDKEIIDDLRRKVQANEAVLEQYGQHALVAKAHDNARAAQQSKDKQ